MKCPSCGSHVTPMFQWARQFRDDPGECPQCGTALKPSWRATWGCLVFVAPVSLVAIGLFAALLIASLASGPGNWMSGLFDWIDKAFGENGGPVVGMIVRLIGTPFVIVGVYYLFHLVWKTGTYQADTNPKPAVVAKRKAASRGGVAKRECPGCGGLSPARSPRCYHCGSSFP